MSSNSEDESQTHKNGEESPKYSSRSRSQSLSPEIQPREVSRFSSSDSSPARKMEDDSKEMNHDESDMDEDKEKSSSPKLDKNDEEIEKSHSKANSKRSQSRSRSRSRSRSKSKESKSVRKRSNRSTSRNRSDSRSPRKSYSRRSRSPRRSRSRRRSISPRRRSRSPRRRRSRSRGRRSRSRSITPVDGARLHVAELDVETRKRDLEKIFEKYGRLREIWMARNPPCFAFVVYHRQKDADRALRETDGMLVGHCRIKVTQARPRVRGGRFRGGYDPNLRCYQCGELGHFSRNCTDTKFGYKRPATPPGSRSRPSRNSRRSRSRSRGRRSRS